MDGTLDDAVSSVHHRGRSAFTMVVITQRKLTVLDAAAKLTDLRVPGGNHLEALIADPKGQHAIRINKQYRVCFTWTDKGPGDVEITDYH